MPQLLRKKPVEVQAVQWTGDNLAELKEFVGDALEVENCRCKNHDDEPFEKRNGHGPKPSIRTMEGTMDVVPYAWVVKGVEGEFYPVDPSVFEDTFDIVSDKASTESVEPTAGAAWSLPVIPYLFNQLSEEAVELAKAANKIIRFGLESVDPKTGLSGRQRLIEEANDVLGVFELLDGELQAQGYASLLPLVQGDSLTASIDKRKANLVQEHDAGRFHFNTEAEG